MTIKNKVIWHEGMALAPQHFQQQTRYIENLVNYKSSLSQNDLWGFTYLELDMDLLAIGKLGIASAKGIFPDETSFDMPGSDEVPTPFTIPEGLNNTVLYLALPLKQTTVAEAGDANSKQSFRYKVLTKSIEDSTADVTETNEVSVGSLACRILTEQDDRDAYTCLPIAKIKEVRSNHQVTFDKTFLISWLDAHQAVPLKKFIEEVHTLLTNRADMLSGRLTDTQRVGAADIVDLMLLQLSNRYEATFRYLGNHFPLHPKVLYFYLVEMMSEMSTYTSPKRRPGKPPLYQHENLFETFQPVIIEARHALSMVLEQNAVAIALQAQDHGLWVGHIHDKALLDTCSFVLTVFADLPLENIRANFPSQVKIAPLEKIRTLVSKVLPGVGLQALAIAPRQIPHHANFSYFAVDTRNPLWAELAKTGGIALHIGSNIPGLKLELWAIKG